MPEEKISLWRTDVEPSTPVAGRLYLNKPTGNARFRPMLGNSSGALVQLDAPSYAEQTAALALKENTITAGSAGQYFAHNKTWANLADIPLSTAATAALAGKISTTEKGANNGVATLDSGGKVPASQLPSYVDDVLMFANLAAFPATGETGKLYVAEDTNIQYRWSGSAYIKIVSGDEAEMGNFFVRHNAAQSLTSAQKLNGRTNIAAAADADVLHLLGNLAETATGNKTFTGLTKIKRGLANVNEVYLQLEPSDVGTGKHKMVFYHSSLGNTYDLIVTDDTTNGNLNFATGGLTWNGETIATRPWSTAAFAPIAHTHTFASLTSKPTTLAGYGITDGASNADLLWNGGATPPW